MNESVTVAFIVNPIAGMGGRVGLKGTDDVVAQAKALGAVAEARTKALATLERLRELHGAREQFNLTWVTCSGEMGSDCLAQSGWHNVEIVHQCASASSAADTLAACEIFLQRDVDLILFCGGDGTARDICSVVGVAIPMLGIPAGVKMYSGVFGVTPYRTAEIVDAFLRGELALRDADVMDLDEELYRQGRWQVRLYAQARTPYEPTFTQAAKIIVEEASEDEVKQDIAQYLQDQMHNEPDTLWILGAGSTLATLGSSLGIAKSLLGIDAVANMRLVAADLNEAALIELLDRYREVRLVLSPIGAQGFVLGRGNSPISATVLHRIGRRNLLIVATPAKLALTPVLRFDTGDKTLDAELAGPGYLPVTIGYGRRRLVKAQC